MALADYLPSMRVTEKKKAQVIDAEGEKALTKAFKVKTFALGYDTIPGALSDRANFEESPYDFTRITNAIDTDSYAKNAFAKFRELFWKEGWSIVGENQEAVDYLYQRLDYMEVAMGRPIQEFFNDIVDQLVRYHNVFIVKSRSDEMDDQFPDDLESPAAKGPVIGYYFIPVEQARIKRDKHNRPLRYSQAMLDGGMFATGISGMSKAKDPSWNAKEVIHLSRDKKVGRAFGTPFLVAALDDLEALRQMEEDYMNLFHRELFPVYTYTIGTEEHPAQPGEVEQAQLAMDDLRTEGGMVMPFRHKLEIVGSEGKTLEVSHFMDHMKERVAVGLGVFPHHLGMVSFAGANKDMTDRLDASLYARVKEYQRVFADFVRMFIFDELLREGGFDPMMNPKIKGEQDRCVMLFDEIDQDGQIKKEAHAIQKATTGVETMSEVRTTLGRPPEMDEADTVPAMQQRLTPTVQAVPGAKTQTGGQQASKIVDVTPSAAQKSSTGGTANMKNLKKGAANVVRPSNQHGARTSPNIRRSDDDWYNEMVELVGEDYRITEEEA